MAADDVLLEVRQLTKMFANSGQGPAGGVEDANFALGSGTFFTLLGPSGCGKTTTLRCIAGLEQPDNGSIRVGERVLFDRAAGVNVPLNLRHIGMVFQSYAIWPHMSVFENVAFPLRVAKDRRRSADEIKRMTAEALDTVGLLDLSDRSATRLSGGQQQRVALARAIVNKPKLLLLDEPLSNLDATLRDEMRKELKKLQEHIGITTVYVTHDQTEALEMSDRIAVMLSGRIVQIASPGEIYRQPNSAFVATFVGSTNWLSGIVQDASGGRDASIRLADDVTVVTCCSREGIRSGQQARVSVRPESVTLRSRRMPQPERVNRLLGKVAFAGFLGSTMRYQVDAGPMTIQAYSNPDVIWNVGDDVAVDFPVEAAFLFESQA